MVKTYKGNHSKGCKVLVATKLYNTHRGVSIRTCGLRKPDKPKEEQDFVVLNQEQAKRLIKQLKAAVK